MLASFFGTVALGPTLNSRLTAMINALTGTDPIAIIKQVPGVNFSLGDDSFFSMPQTPTMPNWAGLFGKDFGCVLFGGMQNNAQLPAITNGWLPNSQPPSVSGINSAFEQAALQVATNTIASVLVTNGPIFLVGHSFGAGTAVAYAAMLEDRGVRNEIKIWTYGMPKIGNFQGVNRATRMRITQFVLLGDPIVHCPPARAECPELYAVLNRTTADGMTVQQTMTNAFQITPTGEISQFRLVATVVPNTYLSLASWLTSRDAFGDTNHSIREYNQAFGAAIVQTPAPPPNPPPLPQAPFVPDTPRERRRLIEIGEAIIFADATSPTGVTRNYVVAPVLTPTAPRYHPRHIGTTWVIYLGDNAVAVATGKRSAKVICRRWNRAARATIPQGL